MNLLSSRQVVQRIPLPIVAAQHQGQQVVTYLPVLQVRYQSLVRHQYQRLKQARVQIMFRGEANNVYNS